MRRRTVAVIGPGESCTNHEAETAYALGRAIAEEGWVVVTGGRAEGVMDAASRGARDAGGIAVGILGGVDPTAASPHVDVVIPSGLGEARNAVVVMSGEVVVACGISPGTSAERRETAVKQERQRSVKARGRSPRSPHSCFPDVPPHHS